MNSVERFVDYVVQRSYFVTFRRLPALLVVVGVGLGLRFSRFASPHLAQQKTWFGQGEENFFLHSRQRLLTEGTTSDQCGLRDFFFGGAGNPSSDRRNVCLATGGFAFAGLLVTDFFVDLAIGRLCLNGLG